MTRLLVTRFLVKRLNRACDPVVEPTAQAVRWPDPKPRQHGAMDVLVVVGSEAPPERLALRAHQVVVVAPDETLANLVADLRGRFPRQIGVVGPGAPEVAVQLRRAGLPIELHADDVEPETHGLEGVEVVPLTDTGPPIDAADSLLDLVGETPLVRLDRTARDLPCQLFAKLELLNPGGSVKDRPAIAMIDEAERLGLLKPGSTIVEGTSGNTGIGLAIVAARRRYRCIFVMPDKMAPEKIALLRGRSRSGGVPLRRGA